VEADQLELTSLIMKEAKHKSVSMFTNKFMTTSLNFKLRAVQQ